MNQKGNDKRPRMSRKRVLLTGIVLLVATFLGVEVVARVLYAPWSIGYFGRETLTGSWVGTMRARQGAEYGLFLNLEYRSRGTSYRRGAGGYGFSNLEGRATLCTPTGDRYEYAVSGFASRSGVVEKMWLEYGDPKLSALNLRLSGAWRPPVLNLAADANPFLPDGRFVPTRPLSGDDPDDSIAPFDLTRGDLENLEDCRRIRR